MRRTIFFFIALLFYYLAVATPSLALESWRDLPVNNCPSYPVISACNLSFIMETNTSLLGQMIIGKPGDRVSTGQSVSGFMANSISFLVKNPPVSSREYFTYLSSRFHVPGTAFPAYAAVGGTGYNQLSPIIRIWVTMRNLAYFFFAIVFVVIGVMIMVRAKTDPKTTATIQGALPKIIIALILVTFSYAISGFLIDVMYVSLALILTVFTYISNGVVGGGTGNPASLSQLLSGSIFEFVGNGGWWDATWAVSGAVSSVTNSMLSPILTGVGGTIAGLVTGGIAILVVGLAILWALFQTWLKLIGAYANIILGIIFSPLQLMMDAIPGQNQFEGWLKTMLSNLLAFPAVVLMLAIGSSIVTNFGNSWVGTSPNGFVPPLLGVGDMGNASAFVGLGIILTIPKIVEMLQQVLKTPQNKWGSAWGEALNWGRGTAQGGAGRFGSYSNNVLFGGPADEWRAQDKAHREDPKANPTEPDMTPRRWVGLHTGAKRT